jgi:hypothetical protein
LKMHWQSPKRSRSETDGPPRRWRPKAVVQHEAFAQEKSLRRTHLQFSIPVCAKKAALLHLFCVAPIHCRAPFREMGTFPSQLRSFLILCASR